MFIRFDQNLIAGNGGLYLRLPVQSAANSALPGKAFHFPQIASSTLLISLAFPNLSCNIGGIVDRDGIPTPAGDSYQHLSTIDPGQQFQDPQHQQNAEDAAGSDLSQTLLSRGRTSRS